MDVDRAGMRMTTQPIQSTVALRERPHSARFGYEVPRVNVGNLHGLRGDRDQITLTSVPETLLPLTLRSACSEHLNFFPDGDPLAPAIEAMVAVVMGPANCLFRMWDLLACVMGISNSSIGGPLP